MQKGSTAILIVLVFASLGLWGCTNQKNGATNVKIRDLEARYSKLEDDYRTLYGTNEASKRRLAQLETERTELSKRVEDLQAAVKERDELKTQLITRTEQRDAMHIQFLQFTKELQALTGRAQATASRAFESSLDAIPASRKSE